MLRKLSYWSYLFPSEHFPMALGTQESQDGSRFLCSYWQTSFELKKEDFWVLGGEIKRQKCPQSAHHSTPHSGLRDTWDADQGRLSSDQHVRHDTIVLQMLFATKIGKEQGKKRTNSFSPTCWLQILMLWRCQTACDCTTPQVLKVTQLAFAYSIVKNYFLRGPVALDHL